MDTILSVLLVIGVAAVYFAFLFLYPRWLSGQKGYSPISVGRIVLMIPTTLFIILALAGAYFHFVLLGLAGFIIGYFLNFRVSKSICHALLMTLWQIMTVASVVVAIMQISNTINDYKKKNR
jgi:hypothetical protein